MNNKDLNNIHIIKFCYRMRLWLLAYADLVTKSQLYKEVCFFICLYAKISLTILLNFWEALYMFWDGFRLFIF